jgi:hypothetical protein
MADCRPSQVPPSAAISALLTKVCASGLEFPRRNSLAFASFMSVRTRSHHAISRGILVYYPASPRRNGTASSHRQRSIAAIKRGTKTWARAQLDDHQQKEAIRRLKAVESCGSIANAFDVHHATIARLPAG